MKQRNGVSIIAIIVGLLTLGSAFGQEPHDHGHHSEGVELGGSVGYVHLDHENEDALGLHLHVSKRLGDSGLAEHLAIGLGGEVVFADHKHYGTMLTLTACPCGGLVVSLGPGVEWAEHEGGWESEFSVHVETAYVFEIGDYDIGPVIGYSWTDHDEHYMAGIHMGIHL